MSRGERIEGAREVREIDPSEVIERGVIRAPSLDELAAAVPLTERLDTALVKLAAAEYELATIQKRLSAVESTVVGETGTRPVG